MQSGAATCGSSITAPPLISSPQVAHAPSCHCVRAAAAAAAAAAEDDDEDDDDVLPFAAAAAATAAAVADCTGGGPAAARAATRGVSSVKPAANRRTAQVPKTVCSPATVCRLGCNRM